MQTSGTAPQFSDGARKTITTKAPNPFRTAPRVPKTQSPKPAAAPHRAGGHARQKRGK